MKTSIDDMQKARVEMKKRTHSDFVKSLPKLKSDAKASPLLKKTIKVVQGKASAETALIEDKSRKLKLSNRTTTKYEKFWNWVESQPWAKWAALTLATLFVAAVMLWGIKQ